MIDKSAVLAFVQQQGPCIPRDVVKKLGGDTMIIGAVLSQLVDGKQLFLTYTKIGGSPVYYASGQEEKLQDLYSFLHEKDKQAYDLLKSSKILRDKDQTPLVRVSLRNIRDFAKGLEVSIQEERELFWKWYLLPNNEAETLIREALKKIFGTKDQSESKESSSASAEQTVSTTNESTQPAQTQEKEEDAVTNVQQPSSTVKDPPKQSPPKQTEFDEEIPDDKLVRQLHSFCKQHDIKMKEINIIRKNSEIELELIIPSPLGKLQYCAIVRDKKRCNDKDLSAAFVKGQMKKLPIIFVSTGELTKKALEMLENEFRNITYFQL